MAIELSTYKNLFDTCFVCDAVAQTFGNGRVVKDFTYSSSVLEIYRVRKNVYAFFNVNFRNLVSYIVFRLFKRKFFAVKRFIARLLLFDDKFCGVISIARKSERNVRFADITLLKTAWVKKPPFPLFISPNSWRKHSALRAEQQTAARQGSTAAALSTERSN